jgi:N-acetylglucosamine-6-phosphate deacetylase
MSDLWITNVRIVSPGWSVTPGSLLLSGGRIARVDASVSPGTAPGASVIDGAGGLLTPGLIDLHTHGIGTHLYERSPEDVRAAAGLLSRFGTTCVLPTLYRVMARPSLERLGALADALPTVRGVSMPGFHLEGPFLALPGAGADTIPGDLELLNDLLAACRGRVLAMSISPDTPNILPVIERLRERRIVPLITHTRATVEQAEAAIAAGAVHATHFYNVFPVPAETEPGCRACGAVEAILADNRVSVDFIADGVHVPPVAIRAALAAKGPDGVLLITDSNIGAGLPPGAYETTWGFDVNVAPGDAARIATPGHPAHGLLAGSALTMDQGMRNLARWLPALPEHDLWSLATANPARLLGLEQKGVIRASADADLVLWDESLRVVRTFVAGACVWTREGGQA